MRVTWLPQVLRDAGLKVAVQPGADGRGREFAATPRGVIAHHTAGPSRGEAPSLGIVTNGRSDLPGPLSQLVLGRSGTYYYVASGRANHAGAGNWQGVTTGNASLLGIEAEATGRDVWPAVQMDAYKRGVAAILRKLGKDASWVCGHKEYALPRGRKPDPNFDMTAFRRDVARILAGSQPTPQPSEEDDMYTDADRARDQQTAERVTRLERLAPRFIRDKDHPHGATYVIDGAGTTRRWIQDGNLFASLKATYPAIVEEWNGKDVEAIPLVGPGPG